MEYRQLGSSDLEVSVVGLGTWGIGGEFFGEVDDKESVRAIQAAVESGTNLIDTAPAYGSGHAEEVVGEAIMGRREKVVLATKVGTYKEDGHFVRSLKPEAIRAQLERSLERLQVDVIDLYQIHWPDPDTPLEQSLETLDRLKAEGKFRYLGVSNFNVQQMEQARELTDLISLQPNFSLLKREPEASLLPYCNKRSIGVLSYGTLAGGVLTGKYSEIPQFQEKDHRGEFYRYFQEPVWGRIQKLLDVMRAIAADHNCPVAQIAINWSIQQPGVTTALVGAKTEAQAQSNAMAGKWALSEEELQGLEEKYQGIMT